MIINFTFNNFFPCLINHIFLIFLSIKNPSFWASVDTDALNEQGKLDSIFDHMVNEMSNLACINLLSSRYFFFIPRMRSISEENNEPIDNLSKTMPSLNVFIRIFPLKKVDVNFTRIQTQKICEELMKFAFNDMDELQ